MDDLCRIRPAIGGPHYALNALRLPLMLKSSMSGTRRAPRAASLPLAIGIGLNYGRRLLGDVGTSTASPSR